MADDIQKIKARESKWQQKWHEARAFVPKNDGSKPKYYNLIEFPFPSGSGLHVGHMLPYTGMDVMARFKRMRGFDGLYPIGYDSRGISSEKYATKIGKHPQQFFKAGLAYKSELPMNWCPNCKTNLTNEELEDGCCERCHGPVEKKMKLQWNLAITKYADRLIDDLSMVDYPDQVKAQQINWIGRSHGAEVDFRVADDIMTVYTTRVDTIFGVTFCVIAPEHKLVRKWLNEKRITNAKDAEDYIRASAAKSEIERTDATREKTGIKLEAIASMIVNPWVSVFDAVANTSAI